MSSSDLLLIVEQLLEPCPERVGVRRPRLVLEVLHPPDLDEREPLGRELDQGPDHGLDVCVGLAAAVTLGGEFEEGVEGDGGAGLALLLRLQAVEDQGAELEGNMKKVSS